MRRNHRRALGLTISLLALLLVPAAAQARDRDRDKLPDRWEKQFHISTKHKSARQDPDRDGLSNLGEFRSKTNPRRKDTDRDGILDGDEDADRDHVDNDNEVREGTRPGNRDSDHDGHADGREDRDGDGLDNAGEDATGNDPTDGDSDDDGTRDGAEQAGVVTSFQRGLLTIDLANGSSVSGLVSADTEIDCDSEDFAEGFHRGPASGSRQAHVSQDDQADDGSEPPIGDPEPGDGDQDNGEAGDPSDNEDFGDDNGDGAGGFGDDGCASAQLVAGARIHEAEGRVVGGVLVFTGIEILK